MNSNLWEGSLSGATPFVSNDQAELVVREYYGFDSECIPLPSEKDSNFLVSSKHGAKYVLKISHPSEEPLVTNLQTATQLHVAAIDPTIPIQRVAFTMDGRPELPISFGGISRIVKLLHYCNGIPLADAPRSQNQSRAIGQLVARFDQSLCGFFHPAAGHDLAWDIKNIRRLTPLITELLNGRDRKLLQTAMNNFDEHFSKRLQQLRSQVIHNDANLHNILVAADQPDLITGLIDFGDVVHTALICELAIAAFYHVPGSGDPIDGIADIVFGYHEILPLKYEELAILPSLIMARALTTIAITEWRAERNPDRSPYILKNTSRAWDTLERMLSLPVDTAQRRLEQLCQMDGRKCVRT